MSNVLVALTPKLIAQGMLALRQNAVMPRLVNGTYSQMAGEKGSSIDVPIPSAISAVAVTPANTPPATGTITPTSVPITMSQWFEAPFFLTDRDMMEALDNQIMPMQASEAIKALANNVDQFLLGLYTGVYSSTGTPGTPVFNTTPADAVNARRILNQTLAPMTDRRFVLDPIAEAAALGLAPFRDYFNAGNDNVITRGQIGTKFGFDFFMNQNVRFHTAGTGSGYLTNNGAGVAAGSTTIPVKTGTGTFVVGDLITFAGHTQTYTVTTAYAGGTGNITISPGLQVAVADNVAITRVASHTVNLAFHRDAIAFASRPLAQQIDVSGLGSMVEQVVDPVTGLALRLEVTREHKRLRFAYDILYGAALVRPELACRVIA